MTSIIVINKSTVVRNADVQTMARACAAQINLHAAPAWGKTPIPVIYSSTPQDAAPGSWVIAILDNPDQANALGWHTESQGEVIFGRVFAKPVLDNGGAVFSGALSISSVLSHEVVETFCDPNVNLWADSGRGYAIALEACDPVESDSYGITVETTTVQVSNFVTPRWFDPQARHSTGLDYLGKLSAPFTMTKGGYWVQEKEGRVSQKFGETFPEWKKALKSVDTGRASRRTQ